MLGLEDQPPGDVVQRERLRQFGRVAGDLGQRVGPGPDDEVGRLERQFNRMVEGLAAARATEHRQVEDEARGAERERIARELHDAVSQDLFTLGMLAGGMEKALPSGTRLQEQAAKLGPSQRTPLRAGRAAVDRLSRRELGVLKALGRGRSNKEIARELGISEETVKSHVSNLLAKLQLQDRTQAAIFALRQLLVPLEETGDGGK